MPVKRFRVAASPFAWLAHMMEVRVIELGLSVRQLADRLAMPVATVHKTLQRQRRVDAIEWLEWVKALQINEPIEFLTDAKRAAEKGPPPPRLRRSTRPQQAIKKAL
jgi:hypothetical protein